jgi:hypothetical protein
MPNAQLIERLDYITPVTLPIISFGLGLATGISWSSMLHNTGTTSFTTSILTPITSEVWDSGDTYTSGTVVSYNGNLYTSSASGNINNDPITSTKKWALTTTPGTFFVYADNTILNTIILRSADITSAANIATAIYHSFFPPIEVLPGTSGISTTVVPSGGSYNVTINNIGSQDGTIILLNRASISLSGSQRATTISIATTMATVSVPNTTIAYTAGTSTITYTPTFPNWGVTIGVDTITLTFTCTSSYITSPPIYLITKPKDSAYVVSDPIQQETLTQSIIRSDTSYVNVEDPVVYLHSMMKNAFYRNLTYIVQQEWQNVIDYSNGLKTLYDVDYYDGDEAIFLSKLDNIFQLFSYTAPLFFTPYVNIENGDTTDLTKQHDFLRNIAKRIWLQRRWAGTLNGYNFLPKFINRLGATHLSVQYNNNSVDTFINKLYRLLDSSKFTPALPGSSTFPDSVNIEGASNINQVKNLYYLWDTGLTWSETTRFDMTPGTAQGVTFSIVQSAGYKFTLTVGGGPVSLGGTIDIHINDVITQVTLILNDTAAQVAEQLADHTPVVGMTITPYDVGNPTRVVYTQTPTPLQYDAPITFSLAAKSLMIEAGLDRVLYHSNSAGSKECLMDTVLLDSMNTVLPNVRRASDIVYCGSQLTLVTSSDGRYNTLSANYDYTHPNIKAKFQVFAYKPDKVTTNWAGADVISYIKIGTGGYRDSSVDSNVFVNGLTASPENPNDASKIVLTDLKAPIFQTSIGPYEKDRFGSFYVVNTVLHPRTISDIPSTHPFLINNIPPQTGYPQASTYMPFTDRFIANGSVVATIKYDNVIPTVIFSAGATGITLVAPGIVVVNSTTFTLTINSGATSSGDMVLAGLTVHFSGVTDAPTTASTIAAAFTAANVGCYVVAVGAKVTMNYYLPNIHQRILVYEKYNAVKSLYDSYFKYQELDASTNSYVDFVTNSSLQGYVEDPIYTQAQDGYFPVVQKQVLNLLPLYIDDQYPNLFSDLVAKYLFDEEDSSSFKDYSIKTSDGTLNSNDSTTCSNITVVPGLNGILCNVLSSGATITVAQTANVYTLTVTGSGTGNILINHTTVALSGGSTSVVADTIALTPIPGFVISRPIGQPTKVAYTGIEDYAYSFNGSSSYTAITPNANGSLNNLTTKSMGIFYNTLGAAVTDAVLIAKEASLGGTTGWGLYCTTSGNTVTLIFRVEQPNSPLSWTALLTYSSSLSKYEWHQATVSFNNIDVPLIAIDGILLTVTQVAPVLVLNPNATGVTFSSSVRTNARKFVFTVTAGCSSSGNISVGGHNVAVTTLQIPLDVANAISVGSNSDWTATNVGAVVTLTFSSVASTETNTMYIGGFSGGNRFSGLLDEVRVYNKALSSDDIVNSFYSVPLRKYPLISSTGNQQYTYIDHRNGKAVVRLQYNPVGPMASLSSLAVPYAVTSLSTVESYKISVADGIVAITEMGLFDTTGSLVAYATFPPVIYNPAVYHLAFNIFISL